MTKEEQANIVKAVKEFINDYDRNGCGTENFINIYEDNAEYMLKKIKLVSHKLDYAVTLLDRLLNSARASIQDQALARGLQLNDSHFKETKLAYRKERHELTNVQMAIYSQKVKCAKCVSRKEPPEKLQDCACPYLKKWGIDLIKEARP